MDTKKNDEPAKENQAQAAPLSSNNPKAEADDQQARQIEELKKLTDSLMVSVHKMQLQSARDAAYFEALTDVKSATNAVLMAQPLPVPAKDAKKDAQSRQGSGCPSPCDCLSDQCCTYDIVLKEARVSSMQFEPGDSNLGEMEIRIFAHLNGIGAVIPGPFSTLTLHKPLSSPALWTTLNTRIGEVKVPHNASKDFLVTIDATEVEHTSAENVAFMRDEHGSANGSITLECCCKPPVIPIEIPFTAGGLGGGNRGSIEVRLTAVKKCD